MGKGEREDGNQNRRQITLHSFRRFVKTTISDLGYFESIKQEFYGENSVTKREILRRIRNVQYSSVILKFSLIITVIIVYIGPGESSKAQTDSMNMNPIIMHIHPMLSLLVNGTPVTVPTQIGIDPSLWKDHSLDEFGMQSMPEMNMSAMAPLHTHDSSGILHVESTINKNYTLGEFLNIWGLNFNSKIVNMTINDMPFTDFRDYVLRDGEQIKLEVQ